MESVGLIIKLVYNTIARDVGGNHPNILICLSFWQREVSLVDIKIDSIQMRTFQQNTRPIYN
ncbi:LOW QUALITY PROTEIN: hypothetical protein HZS_947 [Henneguya salminicola]|nr:LOW QUALITY PROTEIN: hypothetical protein HZS_947 [Henneguya salminicola]